MKLNENVKRVLLCSLWDLATCSKEGMPNVVPVTFKGILDDGTLTVGDVFLETTLRNLEENGGRIAIAKGALIIAPQKVIVTSPGPDNKKEL